MEDAKNVELFIFKKSKEGQPAFYIADELLKLWENNGLNPAAKVCVGRFCFLNGFFVSVIRALKKDLKRKLPLSWPLVFEILKQKDKETIDALLVGATQDQALLGLATAALAFDHPDPRWLKILNEELDQKNTALDKLRQDMIAELKIYETEQMTDHAQNLLSKLVSMFPNDTYIEQFTVKIGDIRVHKKLKRVRDKYPKENHAHLEEVKEEWPELAAVIKKNKKTMDLESSYELSISLHEMGLDDLAVEVLRFKQKQWTVKEMLLEVDFLLSSHHFAEALERSQIILSTNKEDPKTLHACLYNLAVAYHGLHDTEQAIEILKGLRQYNPDYKNISELISDWERFWENR